MIQHKNTFDAVKHIKKHLCLDLKNLLFEIKFPKFSWNNACWVLFIFQYFIKTALRNKFISCVLIFIKLWALSWFYIVSVFLTVLNIKFPTLNMGNLIVNVYVVEINFSWVVDIIILWKVLMLNQLVCCQLEIFPKLILAFVVRVLLGYLFLFEMIWLKWIYLFFFFYLQSFWFQKLLTCFFCWTRTLFLYFQFRYRFQFYNALT